jgi:hypothetical protein
MVVLEVLEEEAEEVVVVVAVHSLTHHGPPSPS